MIPGFFKRGVYAERIRAIIAKRTHVISLEAVDVTPQALTTTDTIMSLLPVHPDIVYVEYEAFGYLAGVVNSNDRWTIEVLNPVGDTLETIVVQVQATGFNQWDIPWYIRGREPRGAGVNGYRLRCTETAGAGKLHVRAARLYGIT